MDEISSCYTYAGNIVAIRKVSPAEMQVEMSWLRKKILGKFVEDCVFTIPTDYGAPAALVHVTFTEVTGEGRKGKLVVNPIIPNGHRMQTVPGISWRWMALHHIWRYMNAEQPNHQSEYQGSLQAANHILSKYTLAGSDDRKQIHEGDDFLNGRPTGIVALGPEGRIDLSLLHDLGTPVVKKSLAARLFGWFFKRKV